MARNYQKEHEWAKEKYARVSSAIPKEDKKILTEYCQSKGISISQWIVQKIGELEVQK